MLLEHLLLLHDLLSLLLQAPFTRHIELLLGLMRRLTALGHLFLLSRPNILQDLRRIEWPELVLIHHGRLILRSVLRGLLAGEREGSCLIIEHWRLLVSFSGLWSGYFIGGLVVLVLLHHEVLMLILHRMGILVISTLVRVLVISRLVHFSELIIKLQLCLLLGFWGFGVLWK